MFIDEILSLVIPISTFYSKIRQGLSMTIAVTATPDLVTNRINCVTSTPVYFIRGEEK